MLKKRIPALILALTLCFALISCGTGETVRPDDSDAPANTPSANTPSVDEPANTEPEPDPVPATDGELVPVTGSEQAVTDAELIPVVSENPRPASDAELTVVTSGARWSDEHPIEYRDPGDFEFSVDLSDVVNYESSLFTAEEVSNLRARGEISVTEVNNGDGTRTVTAVFTLTPVALFRKEGNTTGQVGGISDVSYGVVDVFTGEAAVFTRWDEDVSERLTGGIAVTHTELQGSSIIDYQIPAVKPRIAEVRVTCPADYEGVAFFFQDSASKFAFEHLSGYYRFTCKPEGREILFFKG